MPTIKVDETNKDWFEDQKRNLTDRKKESANDVFDRWRKERGKD
jgi:hypothetical protein